jgi:hypothetical protein
MKTFFHQTFSSKSLISIILCTMLTFCVGVVTHELGHAIAAHAVGGYKNIKVSYAQVSAKMIPIDTLEQLAKIRQYEIENNLEYPEKEYRENLLQSIKTKRLFHVAGASILTFCIGFSAWLLLFFYPNLRNLNSKFSYFVFYSSLFVGQCAIDWIKFLFVLVTSGEELRQDLLICAIILGLPRYSILIFMFLVSSALLAYLFFKMMPNSKRMILLVGVGIGTILGRIIWFGFLGNLLLPK